MRVLITKPHTIVTLRNKRGTPRAMISFAPSDGPITVKREHGEELISAKAATEVTEPASRAPHEPTKAEIKAAFHRAGDETSKPGDPETVG